MDMTMEHTGATVVTPASLTKATQQAMWASGDFAVIAHTARTFTFRYESAEHVASTCSAPTTDPRTRHSPCSMSVDRPRLRRPGDTDPARRSRRCRRYRRAR
jgi:hypothetical protein